MKAKILRFFVCITTLTLLMSFGSFECCGDNDWVASCTVSTNGIISDERILNDTIYTAKNTVTHDISSEANPDEYVYLGGQPIGVEITTEGLTISGFQEIITEKGRKLPAKDAELMIGDVIKEVNGKKLTLPSELISASLNSGGEKIELSVKRGGTDIKTEIYPALDILTGTYKLGIYLQSGVQGIGTLTYVSRDNYEYRALGHTISPALEKGAVKGNIYPAEIIGAKKGERGLAGELKGSFSTATTLGTVTSNSSFGIGGVIDPIATERFKIVKMGKGANARIGKAYIFATVDGNVAERYSIEIVKVNKQEVPMEKGMVIKVTDERLLEKTGGIVQGMSGSPIVQDGALIGAVSHVFVNDPTRGYGVFVEFME